MLKWLAKNLETAKEKLARPELSRLRTMREEAARCSARNRDLVAQGRSPAFILCSRESRNRALGYWFLRGNSTYAPEFALENDGPNDEFGFGHFPRF